VFCQTLHGHDAPAVLKFHVEEPAIAVPFVFCAPDTVAV
jgi:hypothetical protein